MELPELRVLRYKRHCNLKEQISEPLSASSAYCCLSLVLSRTLLNQCQPCELLQFFRIVEAADITYLCKESGHRLDSHSLDPQQLFSHRDLIYQLFDQSHNFLKTYISGFIIFQKHSDLHSCRYCSFFASNAVLCSFDQGLRPRFSNCPHLCIPPDLVHSINTQRQDIFREWRLLKDQHSAFGIRLSVYRLIFRKIYIEPTTDPVLNSCKFLL